MGTQLAVIEPIQLPDRRNPTQIASLPAWLQRRKDALSSERQPDSDGIHREMVVLPTSMMLSSSERQIVERHIDDLQQFLSLDRPFELRGTMMSNDHANGVMIANLLIKAAGAKLDEKSSEALTEDYLDAIEDLPAWSVREAIKKWNRGESAPLDKKPHDFNWRPAPATLRRLAYMELYPIKCRVLELQRVLSAVPLVEFSEEHRRGMLKRVQEVIRDAAPKKIEDVPALSKPLETPVSHEKPPEEQVA